MQTLHLVSRSSGLTFLKNPLRFKSFIVSLVVQVHLCETLRLGGNITENTKK